MQFSKGAAIRTTDGKQVGTLRSLVMAPDTGSITHLVVERGFLFTEERVLPLDWVSSTDRDGNIIVRGREDDIKNLPPFEETHYVPRSERYNTDERTLSEGEALEAAAIPPPALYFTGAPGYFPANFAYGLGNPAPMPGAPGYTTETVENIPNNTVAVPIGTDVVSLDGDRVGTVEEVFSDRDGNATHFVIAKGLLFSTRRLVPTGWVRSVDSDQVQLGVVREVLEGLPDFDAQQGKIAR